MYFIVYGSVFLISISFVKTPSVFSSHLYPVFKPVHGAVYQRRSVYLSNSRKVDSITLSSWKNKRSLAILNLANDQNYLDLLHYVTQLSATNYCSTVGVGLQS